MSKTVDQIYIANPSTTVGNSDLIYLVQSPYTPGTDSAILGSDFRTSITTGAVLLSPSADQTIVNHNLNLSLGQYVSGSSGGGFTGAFVAYPSTATSGRFIMQATNTSHDFAMRITNADFGQPCIISVPDPVASTSTFLLSTAGATQHITAFSLQVDVGALIVGQTTGGANNGLILYSPTSANGNINILAANNGANRSIVITNAAFGQSTTLTIPDPGASAANFLVSKTTGTQHVTVGNLGIDNGALISGLSTGSAAGNIILYSPTASKGFFQYTTVDNTGNFGISMTNAAFGQASTLTIPDPVSSTANFLLSKASGTQHVTAGNFGVDNGSLISGLSTGSAAGNLLLYSPTASKGFFQYTTVDNTGNFGISMTNAAYGQATTLTIPDPGASTASFLLDKSASNKTLNYALTVTGVNFGGTTLTTYTEGTFTPTFTCASVGNLSVVYTNQSGVYTRIGRMVFFTMRLSFTPTFTTASGEARFDGLPFACVGAGGIGCGGNLVNITGSITFPAGRTSIASYVDNGVTYAAITAYGSTVNSSSVQMSGLVSGTAYLICISGAYNA